MNTRFLLTLTAAGLLTLSACNKAESPAKVQDDVAKAASAAAENDSKAGAKLSDVDATANKDVAAAEEKAAVKTSNAAADAAVTQAEGDNRIALAKCEAVSGEAQRACKDQANAQLDLAKAKVKAIKANKPD